MPELLDVHEKERLIQEVFLRLSNIRELTDRATLPQTMRMVAPVLAHLKRRSIADTLHLLEYPHASSASQPHWIALREHVRPFLADIASTYADATQQKAAALYALGWLHRLSRIVSIEEERNSSLSVRDSAKQMPRQERSVTRIELPSDKPLSHNPLAEALSAMQHAEPSTTAREATHTSGSIELPLESTEIASIERPTGGKHLLWVTAFPSAKPRILTEWGERVPCSSLLNFNIPDIAKFIQDDGSEGFLCLAEVAYKNGAAVSARFTRWVTEDDYE